MKIQVPFSYNDELRKAINHYQERPGMATRQEMRSWFYKYGISRDIELLSYYSNLIKKGA